MKKSRFLKLAVISLLVLGFILTIGSPMIGASKYSKAKGPKPPKERTMDVAVTKRPTTLKTSGGVVIAELPTGVSFPLERHKGNTVWVYGPTGQVYQLPKKDVNIIKGHKASVANMKDAQLRSFGLQVTALRAAAMLTSTVGGSSTTTVSISVNSVGWEDSLLINMAVRAQMSMPQMFLMFEWATYSGYIH